MRTVIFLLAASLVVAVDSVPAQAVLVADQRAVAEAEGLPPKALQMVQARKHVLFHPPGRSPLLVGLNQLARSDARYALRTEVAPMAGFYKERGLGTHQASTGVRADTVMREFSKALGRVASAGLDDATVHLSPSAVPDNHRIEQPYKQHTAAMEINVSSAGMAGVFRENITGTQVIQGGNATLFNGPLTFPIELPNVAVGKLRTQAAVRAGIGPDDDGWQVDQDPRAPRDVRRAWDDYRRGLGGATQVAANTRIVWTTMPLAKDGNVQRNLFNQWVREHCAKNGLPLLDIAAIQAHDATGQPAYDNQGYRLSDAWRSTELGREQMTPEGEMRLAKAWWWLNARLAGWEPDSAASDTLDLSGS